MSIKEVEVDDDLEAEAIETLASLPVADLIVIKGRVDGALRMKGQKFIDGFGVGGLTCESVEVMDDRVKCRVNCGSGQTGWIESGVLGSIMVERGYKGGVSNTQPNGTVVMTFFLSPDVLNNLEVEEVVDVVAGQVTEAVEIPS